MLSRFRARYYDVLASIYLYNEYQGYTGLERLLAAIRQRYPDEGEFIAAVTKHTDDERKHYRMFKHYFEAEGRMPFLVDRTCGYIDRFVAIIFGRALEELDEPQLLADERLFFKLCRLIMMTEFRGMKQVAVLLRSRLVHRNDRLMRIFRVIERDEPSHCFPYQHWLRARGSHEPGFEERFTDLWVHYSLMLLKFPLVFLNAALPRRRAFPA